jgi:hypothetical protein
MSDPIIGYSSPGGEPAVRGHLVVEVATIVRIPTCPICGTEHRFVLADVAWAAKHHKLWQVTCPLVEPQRRFLVRLMSPSSHVAMQQGEQIAAQTRLGKTWELGVTWAPASCRMESGLFIHDTAERLAVPAEDELDREPVD